MTNSLDRGLDALELIADRGQVKLAEFAEALEVSRATAFRMLSTLQKRGYVEHDRDEHTYRLGPAPGELSARGSSSSIMRLAAPALADLRATTAETINLALLRRGRLIWGATVDAAHAIRLTTTVGEEIPPHATAVGKAVLAALPDNQWGAILGREPFPRLTDRTITKLAALRAEVDEVRAHGHAEDHGESEIGGVCVAAAILGRSGAPVGAISVAGIAQRMPPDRLTTAAGAVRDWCARISHQLQAERGNRTRRH